MLTNCPECYFSMAFFIVRIYINTNYSVHFSYVNRKRKFFDLATWYCLYACTQYLKRISNTWRHKHFFIAQTIQMNFIECCAIHPAILLTCYNPRITDFNDFGRCIIWNHDIFHNNKIVKHIKCGTFYSVIHFQLSSWRQYRHETKMKHPTTKWDPSILFINLRTFCKVLNLISSFAICL